MRMAARVHTPRAQNMKSKLGGADVRAVPATVDNSGFEMEPSTGAAGMKQHMVIDASIGCTSI